MKPNITFMWSKLDGNSRSTATWGATHPYPYHNTSESRHSACMELELKLQFIGPYCQVWQLSLILAQKIPYYSITGDVCMNRDHYDWEEYRILSNNGALWLLLHHGAANIWWISTKIRKSDFGAGTEGIHRIAQSTKQYKIPRATINKFRQLSQPWVAILGSLNVPYFLLMENNCKNVPNEYWLFHLLQQWHQPVD